MANKWGDKSYIPFPETKNVEDKIKKGKKKHGDHYPATDSEIDEVYGVGAATEALDAAHKKKKKK
tara:strand:+ start:884 stop:1078 length:195 start_codon:yes stop_codon:yes gene_type:complete